MLLNLADMRTVHSREALASLQERFGEQVFETVIRASIAYAESAERARSILDHRPDLGADYLALAAEVLARLPGARRTRASGSRSSPSGERLRLQLAHVGALRLERRRAARSPSPRPRAASASATAPVCS